MSAETTNTAPEKSWNDSSEQAETSQAASISEHGKKNSSAWRTVQRYIWDDPDKPAAEKKFLRKLDFFLLTYTCLGYFCKNLDQGELSTATRLHHQERSVNICKSQYQQCIRIGDAGGHQHGRK